MFQVIDTYLQEILHLLLQADGSGSVLQFLKRKTKQKVNYHECAESSEMCRNLFFPIFLFQKREHRENGYALAPPSEAGARLES